MSRITVDAALRGKLQSLEEPVEICDEAGHVLGRFLPTVSPATHEDTEPRISKEELQRRIQNKGKTYTTAEVLAHLERL